jgi:hypothetical protein
MFHVKLASPAGWSLQAWPARTCASSHSTPRSRGADLPPPSGPPCRPGPRMQCSSGAGAREAPPDDHRCPRHCRTRGPLLTEWVPVSQCIPCEGRFGSCVGSGLRQQQAAVLEMVLSVGGSAPGVRSGRCPHAGVRSSGPQALDAITWRDDAMFHVKHHLIAWATPRMRPPAQLGTAMTLGASALGRQRQPSS